MCMILIIVCRVTLADYFDCSIIGNYKKIKVA